jgi:hypothetical protein
MKTKIGISQPESAIPESTQDEFVRWGQMFARHYFVERNLNVLDYRTESKKQALQTFAKPKTEMSVDVRSQFFRNLGKANTGYIPCVSAKLDY